MKKLFFTFLISLSLFSSYAGEIDKIKAELISKARSFQGLGDPDFKIQNELEPLVNRLLKLSPQPSIKERQKLLVGTWKQEWGPYDYRGDDRGVDPNLKVDEIYQVVFEEGFYYNVNPNMRNEIERNIGLLKGQYRFDDENQNVINVKFLEYPGNKTRPANLEIWELPSLAESGDLPEKITVVPWLIVRLFFGGGKLNEVYTDEDLRITYGNSSDGDLKNYLYIMTRVN